MGFQKANIIISPEHFCKNSMCITRVGAYAMRCAPHQGGHKRKFWGWGFDETTRRAIALSPVIQLLFCLGHIYGLCRTARLSFKRMHGHWYIGHSKHGGLAGTRLWCQGGWKFMEQKRCRDLKISQIKNVANCQGVKLLQCLYSCAKPFWCIISFNLPSDPVKLTLCCFFLQHLFIV